MFVHLFISALSFFEMLLLDFGNFVGSFVLLLHIK